MTTMTMDAVKVMAKMTIKIEVRRRRKLRARIMIGTAIMKLGATITGAKVEVSSIGDAQPR